MPLKWREQSTTRPEPIGWPFCEVPPPRMITGTSCSAAIVRAAAMSAAVRGKTTPAALQRLREAPGEPGILAGRGPPAGHGLSARCHRVVFLHGPGYGLLVCR
jgi:hypothetical protein